MNIYADEHLWGELEEIERSHVDLRKTPLSLHAATASGRAPPSAVGGLRCSRYEGGGGFRARLGFRQNCALMNIYGENSRKLSGRMLTSERPPLPPLTKGGTVDVRDHLRCADPAAQYERGGDFGA
jgi:hypothetical protein